MVLQVTSVDDGEKVLYCWQRSYGLKGYAWDETTGTLSLKQGHKVSQARSMCTLFCYYKHIIYTLYLTGRNLKSASKANRMSFDYLSII